MYVYKKGFRPRNWTCIFTGCYEGVSPKYVDGDYYLKLECDLETKNPLAYNHIMWFAKSNDMTIENEEDIEKTCSKKFCG